MDSMLQHIVVMDLKGIPSVGLLESNFFGSGLCDKIVVCFLEMMNRTYTVNISMTFQVVWTIAKVFMDERTNAAKNQFFLQYFQGKERLSPVSLFMLANGCIPTVATDPPSRRSDRILRRELWLHTSPRPSRDKTDLSFESKRLKR
jgi:hypothetical protein